MPQTLHAAQATHEVDGQVELLQALAAWRRQKKRVQSWASRAAAQG